MLLAFRIGSDNTPPTIVCPPPRTLAAGTNCTATVDLRSAARTSDNSAAPVTISQTPSQTTPLGLGTHTITLVATDAAGNQSEPCTTLVTVTDQSRPTITSVTPSQTHLWPPDGSLVPITINITATDNCSSTINCQTVAITSNDLRYGRVEFAANGGTTYKVCVDGFRSATSTNTGVVILHWALGPPANDSFANAQTLSGTNGTVTGCNAFASEQNREPDHVGNDGGRSMWYKWQAPASGLVAIDLAGSYFDTLLAVYRADAPAALDRLIPVAQNDDRSDGFILAYHSRVQFMATAGQPYYIAVDGVNDSAGYISDGWLVLNYKIFPPPTLQFSRSGQNLIVQWSGPYILESTPTLGAAWTTVMGSPPVMVPISPAGNRFFRAVSPLP